MTVYPTRKSPWLTLFALGGFLVFLPAGLGILAAFTRPEMMSAFFAISLVTVPPGLILVSMGSACKRLHLEIDPGAGLLRARLPRQNLICFPWQIKSISLPFTAVDRVDLSSLAASTTEPTFFATDSMALRNCLQVSPPGRLGYGVNLSPFLYLPRA